MASAFSTLVFSSESRQDFRLWWSKLLASFATSERQFWNCSSGLLAINTCEAFVNKRVQNETHKRRCASENGAACRRAIWDNQPSIDQCPALSRPINPTFSEASPDRSVSERQSMPRARGGGATGGTRSCAVWLVAVFRFGRDTRITKRLAEISL